MEKHTYYMLDVPSANEIRKFCEDFEIASEINVNRKMGSIEICRKDCLYRLPVKSQKQYTHEMLVEVGKRKIGID